MSEERDLPVEFLSHLSQSNLSLSEGDTVSKRQIAEEAVNWAVDHNVPHSEITWLIDYATEFLSTHDVTVVAAKRPVRPACHLSQVSILEVVSQRPTVLLKRALLDLVAKGDSRFNAEAWIEVWLTDGDLEMEKAIQELKTSDEPTEGKVAKAKEFARDLATKMLTDLSQGGIKINWQNINLDAEMDRIDWTKLVSNDSKEASKMDNLPKVADAGGLDLLVNTTEDQWVDQLQARDTETPIDTESLKKLWYAYTQSAIEDLKKVSPMMEHLEDYNRMKRAFDQFAESKGLPKWNPGTLNDEWKTP